MPVPVYVCVHVFLSVCLCVPILVLFVCVEVLWPSQPNRVMSSAVSLPNHTFLLGLVL